MPPAKKIRIVKVPLSDNERLPDYPINFPPMPILYLELLENKSKIKQELVNKDYVPPKVLVDPHAKKDEFNIEEGPEESREESREEFREKSEDEESREESSSDSSNSSVNFHEKIDVNEDRESDEESNLSDRLKELLGDDSNNSPVNSPLNSPVNSHIKSSSNSSSISSNSSSESDDSLSDRSIEKHNKKRGDKYSRAHKSPLEGITSYTPYKTALPPTLKELEAKGQFQRKTEMRDMYNISMSEKEEEDKKRELLFKFEIMRKSYKEQADKIPVHTMHTPLVEMQRSYEDTIRILTLDSNVSSYRMYLIGGFMVVEYVFGNFLGFDMHGFAKHQILSMSSYEKLLIELGEKSYTPGGSKFPVELRLLFMIIVNAGFFIVGKMLMKKTGADLLGMINSSVTASQAPPVSSAPKRRMRGPNIKLDDIPDIDEKYNVAPEKNEKTNEK